jgi:hypothetical protein
VCGKTKQKDAMTKAKTKPQAKPARKAKLKPHGKPSNAAAPNPDCPYRSSSLYGVLFAEANRDYVSKDELLKRVAEKTGKPIRSVEFAYQVLKSKSHKSNGGRSCELQEDGKVKLICIQKPRTE